MPSSGTELGVDLYRLEQVATNYLPTAADAYQGARDGCRDIETGIDGIAPIPHQFAGSQGPALHIVGDMQRLIASILDETTTSLRETAGSLAEAAKLYAERDHAAAAEFHRLLGEQRAPDPER